MLSVGDRPRDLGIVDTYDYFGLVVNFSLYSSLDWI